MIEIGRKIRAPEDEEEGVRTYSVLWGRRRAVAVWLVALALTAGLALVAARLIDFVAPSAFVFGGVLVAAALVACRFLLTQAPGSGRAFEAVSGIWTLAMYLSRGAAPLVAR